MLKFLGHCKPSDESGNSLMVMDFFGTIAGGYKNSVRRLGLAEFLEANGDKTATLYTDGAQGEYEPGIDNVLQEMGIADRFTKPFFFRESLTRSGLKDLNRVSREYNVAPERIYMIGDGRKDYDSAVKYNTRLFLVPPLMKGRGEEISIAGIGNLDMLFGDYRAVQMYLKNEYDPASLRILKAGPEDIGNLEIYALTP